MKQIFTLLVVLSLTVVGYGQSFKNTPLISKRTADWCPNCGSWGWTFKLAILDEISSEDATIVALHHSGGLANATSTAITEAMGGVSQPKFFFNNTDIGASSGNWNNKLDELKADVAAMNMEIPDFGIELHGYLGASANEVVAEINLHVNQSVEGEYYLGTYILTNDLVHMQAGNSAGGSAEHKKILLDEFSGTPFGRVIGNGPLLEGVMNFDITTTFANVPDAQTDIAVIIWKKDGNDYIIANTAVVEGIELLSTNDDFNWVSDASAVYFDNQINIDLSSEETIGEYQVKVIDMNGRIVADDRGMSSERQVNLQLDASGLTSGNYFINFLSSNGLWSEKVVVVK